MYVFFCRDPSAALAGMRLHSTARRRGENLNEHKATMAEMQMHSTATAPYEDTNTHSREGRGNGKGCYTRERQEPPPTKQMNKKTLKDIHGAKLISEREIQDPRALLGFPCWAPNKKTKGVNPSTQ